MEEEGFVGSDLFVGACLGDCFSGVVLGWPVREWSCACGGVARACLVGLVSWCRCGGSWYLGFSSGM